MTRRTWHDVMPSMPGTWHDVAFMSFYMALMPSDVALMPSDLAGLGHGKWEISGSLLVGIMVSLSGLHSAHLNESRADGGRGSGMWGRG